MKERRLPTMSRRGWLLTVPIVSVWLATGLPARLGAAQDATALLEASAAAMFAVESFHFVITTDNGSVVIADRIELERVEGDYQRPARRRATATGKVGFMPVGIDLIVIEDKVWYSDPVRRNQYAELELDQPQLQEILVNFDPGAVLLAAAEHVADPVVVGTEEVDGTPATLIEGTVDLSPLAANFPDAGINEEPLAIRLWLNDADLLVRLQIVGQVVLSEPAGIVHQLDLSAFDEPVSIEAPGS
jgi:hypothetical protein